MAADEPLLDVAVAVADGTAVDWESAAQAITNTEDRRLLAELRFIAGVARPMPHDSSGFNPAAPERNQHLFFLYCNSTHWGGYLGILLLFILQKMSR